ncbi:thioesterase family protein [Nocardioides marmoribigeumensis]|uniref:Thioesterase n=1 Tax=Nocardioides marmoribigeumensis TaxID=433649 RepID=A0ABU2BYX8_9ACTN|nr:hotdog domain-containing protein [Nocardioides marmoribigeumensis]MDR7363579.1 putative thioesterase [Nocardioides marmoribigeumensis]
MSNEPAATLTFTVTDDDTAAALGSGDLPVLATPRLLAWLEAATCAAVEGTLDGTTTVGTRVALEHLAASGVGEQVRVSASVSHRDGRLLRFAVEATDARGRLVGQGEVTRVAVDPERFLARLG